MDPICRQTLKQYASRVLQLMVLVIKKEIFPQTFGLIFDGWTAPGTHEHYVALYATFLKKDTTTKMKVLLAMSPMNEAADLTADAHMHYISDMLEYYGRTLQDVEFLCGDNCNTNGATADLIGAPLVGCAAHRFNLALKTYFDEGELKHPVEKVEDLMNKLSTIKMCAQLRNREESNGRVAKKRQVTRWQGTTNMLKRYMQLAPHLQNMELPPDLLNLIPNVQEHRLIKNAMGNVKEFNAAFVPSSTKKERLYSS